jgi:predicted alpha-1,2-mannosidase
MNILKLSQITFFFFISLNGFSQLEELKKNQEIRKEYIDPSKNDLNSRKRYDFSKHVNLFIGTGAHGHTHPAASAPFGMIQLGPDTRYNGWDGCSGYHFSDSVIFGFSHTHLSGTGVEDLCDLLLVPQQGKVKTKALYEDKNGYGSTFSHKDEKAEPGYYAVKLIDNNIDVRLAASERAGIQEYTFNNPLGKKFILIDLSHRDQLLDFEINKDEKNKKIISGKRISKAWAKNQHFYFYLELENEYLKAKLVDKTKLILEFPENTKTIRLKVGISGVSIDGAQKNLFEEIQGFDLDIVKNTTRNKWNVEMNKLHFKSDDMDVMTNFYTAIYHSYLTPTLFSDVDGFYRGNDNKIYQNLKNNRYTIFSLWDTYRTAHPLYTLTQQKRTGDFINTFLEISKETGELPVWELWGNETDCMIGYHSVSVILDAYRKGIQNFDTKFALESMLKTAQKDELGKHYFANQGFIGSQNEPESVSKTLEYTYNDWCISEFAKDINASEGIIKKYAKNGLNFINLFDPQTKFMRPRNGGIWHSPFVPSEVNFNYTEANSFQYSLAVPQEIVGLRTLLGGKDSLEAWLDRLFASSSLLEGRQQSDITGLIGQYAHGNEPSHHMAYLYNYTNKPYKTQEKVDQILKELYQNNPEGLSGNEDCGQMSAWYVMSAVGLYPICPGKAIYTFGRPIQEYANFHFENNKTFSIRTLNNSPANKYIQEIELNGKKYTKLYITHEDLLAGGELVFHMGNTPNQSYNFYESDIDGDSEKNLQAVPYFTANSNTFEDSIVTEIKLLDGIRAQIRYTTDNSEPTQKSMLYTNDLVFHETTTLKAKAFYLQESQEINENIIVEAIYEDNGFQAVSSTFYKLNKGLELKLTSTYNNQYTGGGDLALVDGINGGKDFRSGPWQGYQGNNAEGIISFMEAKELNELTISCLQDVKSWIFMPTALEVQISYDGINFEKPVITKIKYQSTIEGNFIEQFSAKINAAKPIKNIKYKAINRGTCPKGHLGEGEKSWIFIDEITFK